MHIPLIIYQLCYLKSDWVQFYKIDNLAQLLIRTAWTLDFNSISVLLFKFTYILGDKRYSEIFKWFSKDLTANLLLILNLIPFLHAWNTCWNGWVDI